MSFSRNPQKRTPRTPSRSKGGGGENCHNSFPLVQCWRWIAIKTFLGGHKNWPIFSLGMYQLGISSLQGRHKGVRGLNLLPEKAGSSLENDTLLSSMRFAYCCFVWEKSEKSLFLSEVNIFDMENRKQLIQFPCGWALYASLGEMICLIGTFRVKS